MTDKLIQAPAPVWGNLTSGQAEQKFIECFNNSGAVLTHGDVVVIDNSAGQMPTAPGTCTGAVTTTTTVSDPKVLGVVSVTGTADTSAGTVAAGAAVQVCIGGVARVNIAANTVAAGANLSTSAAAKVAATAGTAATVAALQALVGTFIGIALEAQTAKDANNTIRCLISKM
jgi:hypothetical protein